MPPSVHDTLVKHALSDPSEVGAWLGIVLSNRPWASLVAWPDLTILGNEHPAESASTRSDFVFSAPLEPNGRLVLPIEHQTRVDRRIALRQLGYVAHLVERPELARQAVVVVPIVLYTGRSRWTASRSLRSALGVSAALAFAFGQDLPQLSYVLLDLWRMPEPGGAPAGIRLALALLREGRAGSAWRALGAHAGLLPEVMDRRGRSYVQRLLEYAYAVEDAPPSEEVVKMIASTRDDVAEAFVSYADQLRAEGLERGLEQGASDGLRRALRMVLQGRFGALSASAGARIGRASVPELEAWLLRVGAVGSVEEMFGRP